MFIRIGCLMENKLTLKLNKDVIERAKLYAMQNKISLSKLIETYLDTVAADNRKTSISPTVESLIGVIELPEDFDYKEELSGYISEKYK